MLLKVCGMRDPENIAEVAQFGPDMLGFIFYEKSPRHAADVLRPVVLNSLDPNIRKVAVMVNPGLAYVKEVIGQFNFDYVQLHGDESIELIEQIHGLGVKIIKAVPGNRSLDQAYMNQIEPLIDFWLLDTRTDLHGGTGIAFDRKVLYTYDFTKPVILSGGLDEEIIREILREDHPKVVGVDVNSKMEDAPGLKNSKKIKAVVECLK